MKYVLWLALVVVAVVAAWRIIQPEIVNIIFQDDLRDAAAQIGPRIGFSAPTSDGDLRAMVFRKAEGHSIHLDPSQVTLQSTGPSESRVVYIKVDYTVPVNLFVYSFRFHFHPTSGNKF
jgi:hypothetical protein